MDAKKLKKSAELASVVLRGKNPLATEKAITLFEYVGGQKTEQIKAFATTLILPGQNFERVRCQTPSMPRVFLSGDLQEVVVVELVNPIAEITWNNEIRFYADDIVLSSEEEVIDL